MLSGVEDGPSEWAGLGSSLGVGWWFMDGGATTAADRRVASAGSEEWGADGGRSPGVEATNAAARPCPGSLMAAAHASASPEQRGFDW